MNECRETFNLILIKPFIKISILLFSLKFYSIFFNFLIQLLILINFFLINSIFSSFLKIILFCPLVTYHFLQFTKKINKSKEKEIINKT